MTPISVDTHSSAMSPSSPASSIRSGAPVTPPRRRVSALVRHTAVSRPARVRGAAGSVHTISALTGRTTARQHAASQPISAPVLRARVLSKR
ncbi:hypothetical protein [Streptomyces sp. NPDC059861]|uniref:hypothetical protein n=1 Tax=Streptomyces sp. NPDC059861 TaxID=3346974 RepID=UPI003654A263